MPYVAVQDDAVTSTIDHALRRLEGSSSAIWLVQCNPRLTAIFSDPRGTLPGAWCVKRHTTEIRRGDRMVLWLSGAESGVYALGEVDADVQPVVRSPVDTAPPPVTQASVDLFLHLFERPVRRTVLKADARFAGTTIMRQPFAANPHRLSAGAFDAILERIARSG